MKYLIIVAGLILCCAPARAQCGSSGKLIFNPLTGLPDCTGSGGGGGSGTVTSVSVTTANGVSGSVATATTTPAITLTLGAITPTTIVASGLVTASAFSSGSSPPAVTPGTGGGEAYAEGTVPSVGAAAGVDICYGDSTQHGILCSRNNGAYLPIPQGPVSTTSGNIPTWNSANGGLLGAGFTPAAGVQTFLTTPSGANLTTALTTPLTVGGGGTGAATLAVHGPLVGEATSAIVATSPGTTGQCYLSNGASADPSFQSCPGGAGAGNSVTSTTPVTVNTNTTSDQQLMELSLGAGYFNSSKQPFLFDGAGVYTTQTAQTPTVTLKVKLCTVSGCGSGTVVTLISIVSTATVAAVTNNNWNLAVLGYTATTGATGNLEIHGPLAVDLGALTTTADSLFVDTNTAVSSNIDLTAALFVDFTVAFSTNAATANTFTQRSGGVMPFAATAAPVTSVFTQTGAVGNLTGDVTTAGSVATTVGNVNGIAYSATAAAHSVEVITTANTTATAKAIPDCTDTGGNHINFTQSTDAFSCGTSGSGGSSTQLLNWPLASVVAGSTTSNFQLFSTQTTTSGNEARIRTYMPVAGTLQKMYLWVNQAANVQPGTGSLVCTILKNNSGAGAPTITIASSATVTTVQTDLSSTLSVAAGDYLELQCVNNASTSSVNISNVQAVLQ